LVEVENSRFKRFKTMEWNISKRARRAEQTSVVMTTHVVLALVG